MATSNYFFAYSLKLRHDLKARGFSYVCTGMHPKTHKQFWLFERTEALDNALDEIMSGSEA